MKLQYYFKVMKSDFNIVRNRQDINNKHAVFKEKESYC